MVNSKENNKKWHGADVKARFRKSENNSAQVSSSHLKITSLTINIKHDVSLVSLKVKYKVLRLESELKVWNNISHTLLHFTYIQMSRALKGRTFKVKL